MAKGVPPWTGPGYPLGGGGRPARHRLCPIWVAGRAGDLVLSSFCEP